MGRDLVEVGWYPLLSVANDRALVVLALGVGCWVLKRDEGYGIYVEPSAAASASVELARFERESEHAPPAPGPPPARLDPAPLFLFGWAAAACMIAQKSGPAWWVERGTASSGAILAEGEWWRVITALTLHADLPHFLANLATGLLFGAFLVPLLGGGLTWAGFLFAGGLGNWLNAWGYRAEGHHSLGASTGVFALLGMLVACQTAELLRRRRLRLWECILPIGAGLALLAYLGTGGGGDLPETPPSNTDIMAHLWGFLAGIATGAPLAFLRAGERVGRFAQAALGLLALLLAAAAWTAAARWGG